MAPFNTLYKYKNNLVISNSRVFREIYSIRNIDPTNSYAVIYEIICLQGENIYIGEGSRNVNARIYGHERNLHFDNTLNSVVRPRSN